MGPIGVALISNSVVAAGLCGVAELIWRRRRPALAHAIWLLALLKLLTPPLWHVTLPSPSAPDSAVIAAKSNPIVSTSVPMYVKVSPAAGMTAPRDTKSFAAPISQHIPVVPQSHWNVANILIFIWACGSIGLFVIAIVRARGFARILNGAEPAGRGFTQEIREMANRLELRRVAEARIVQGDIPPMIWFMGGRALMLFPRAVLEMEPDKRAGIIAHELAHLHRGDHWVRLLEMFATAAFWWHPLVWLARSRLREAEEEACDAWVVWAMPQARKSYAGVLVEMARVISGRFPAGASGLGGFGHLHRRLIMILEKTPQRSLRIGSWIILGLLATSLPLAMAQGTNAPPAVAKQPAGNPAPASDVTSIAVKALLDATVNGDPAMQQTATASIMTFGPKAIPVLVEGMKVPATVQISRILLTNFGRDAVDPLIAVLNSGDPSQRFLALITLEDVASELGWSSPPIPNMQPPGGFYGGYAPPLYNAEGLAEPGYGRSPGAAYGVPPGMPAIRDIDSTTQQALGRIELAVAKATSDSDKAVRNRAAAFLGKISVYAKDNSAIDRLIELVSDEDAQVRQSAIQSLIALGSKAAKAVPTLMTAATDRDAQVRVAAIQALGSIGPDAKDAMATLVQSLKDSDPRVRLVAASAMGRINRAQGQ